MRETEPASEWMVCVHGRNSLPVPGSSPVPSLRAYPRVAAAGDQQTDPVAGLGGFVWICQSLVRVCR